MDEISLDVRELSPPEPLTKILQALAVLKPHQYLKVHHQRVPFPLFEKLASAGWAYVCQPISKDVYHIYIYLQTQQNEFSLIDESLIS